MRTYILSIAGLLLSAQIAAQHLPFPVYQGDNGLLLRAALTVPDAPVHFAMQPYTFDDVDSLTRSLQAYGYDSETRLSRDYHMLMARLGQAPLRERPLDSGLQGWLSRTLYTQPGYALAFDKPSFKFRLNPVLDVSLGTQTNTDDPGIVMQNTRGITAWGQIDERVSFQTTLHENQARLPSWEREWRRAYNNRVPGVGFYKAYDPLLFDANDAVDYFQATGEVGIRVTDHIKFRFGHGNPRVGLGYRSMILDDFADPFLYAQIDTRVWKLHYRNLYTQMQDGVQSFNEVNRKYVVAHTLSMQLSKRWEVGLTEQTVLTRQDGFDVQYLNPIILYRAVEQDNGSPDNAMIGLHSNLKFGASSILYSQFLLDEFKFDELFGGDGWWANKYALQLGLRSFNVAKVQGLDLGIEYNQARPFTYGHRKDGIAYTHYDQPLAHPWGADLQEIIVKLNYQPADRWQVLTGVTYMRQGDVALPATPHIGANVLYSNGLRATDYGYETAQVSPVERVQGSLTVQFAPIHGSRLYARYDYYSRSSDTNQQISQHGVRVGLSLNAIQRSTVF